MLEWLLTDLIFSNMHSTRAYQTNLERTVRTIYVFVLLSAAGLESSLYQLKQNARSLPNERHIKGFYEESSSLLFSSWYSWTRYLTILVLKQSKDSDSIALCWRYRRIFECPLWFTGSRVATKVSGRMKGREIDMSTCKTKNISSLKTQLN